MGGAPTTLTVSYRSKIDSMCSRCSLVRDASASSLAAEAEPRFGDGVLVARVVPDMERAIMRMLLRRRRHFIARVVFCGTGGGGVGGWSA